MPIFIKSPCGDEGLGRTRHNTFNAKEWNKKYGQTFYGLKEQNIPFPYTQCKAGTLETFEQCSKLAEMGVFQKNMSMDNQPCFNFWTQSLQNNLKPIMMVMRIASRRGQSHFNTTEFVQPFAAQMNITRYTLKTKSSRNVMMRDKVSYLPGCSYSSGLDTIGTEFNCTLFKPVVTDSGICYSFNAKPTDDLLKDSIFKQTMREVYKHELGGTSEIHKAKGAGDKFALRFWVDNSKRFQKKKQQTKPYKVLISSADGYMNILSNGIEAMPGYVTTFLVQPIQVFATENVHNVLKEKRNCNFPDETNGDSIFIKYSQASCELECKFNVARKKCHCTPWNVPSTASLENSTICDLFGTHCFLNEMTNVSILETCIKYCPSDCNNVRFDIIEERRTQIDTDVLCHRMQSSGFSRRDCFF